MERVHYRPMQKGGMKAAYIAEPRENIEAVVRAALGMEGINPEDPLRIADLLAAGCRSYIIDGRDALIYCTYNTPVQDTSINVTVPKDSEGNVIVVIDCKFPSNDAAFLEGLIATVIYQNLGPDGLFPMRSSIDEIPGDFLKDRRI